MTAQRIDHVAEARDIVVEMGYPHSNADLIAYAQVHATLALVEQQRLANLLALARDLDPVAHSAVYIDSNEWGASSEIRPEIREALGLA